MPDHLQKIAAASAKAKQMAAQRIAPQNLLDLQGQRREAPAHIGVARRQPKPHAGWEASRRPCRRRGRPACAARLKARSRCGCRRRALRWRCGRNPPRRSSLAPTPKPAEMPARPHAGFASVVSAMGLPLRRFRLPFAGLAQEPRMRLSSSRAGVRPVDGFWFARRRCAQGHL